MAWIETQEGKMFDTSCIYAFRNKVEGKSSSGSLVLGIYQTKQLAQDHLEGIKVWIENGENGIFKMPSFSQRVSSPKSPHSHWERESVMERTCCCHKMAWSISNRLIEPQTAFIPGIGKSSARLVWKQAPNTSISHAIGYCPFCGTKLEE